MSRSFPAIYDMNHGTAVAYAAREGGLWERVLHPTNLIGAHAVRYADGCIWDVVNGWHTVGPLPVIYLIGSLRNPNIPVLGTSLREAGFEVFDDWFAAGPEADDYWQKYEQGRGRSYGEALKGLAARNVFEFDKKHLDRANVTVLVMPAGKSGHLEFGRSIGRGLPSYVVFPGEEPERWDVMYQFATDVFFNDAALIERLRKDHL